MSVTWLIAALALVGPKSVHDADVELWPMTLQQATRIALDNSESARVIAFAAEGVPIGGFEPALAEQDDAAPEKRVAGARGMRARLANIVIARRNADTSIARLKSDAMATVSLVEELYWSLCQAHAALLYAPIGPPAWLTKYSTMPWPISCPAAMSGTKPPTSRRGFSSLISTWWNGCRM